MPRDYYDILGVARSSNDSEIKQAYRKLAKQYHPDRHKGDKKAEEKFKEISEAYAVLSDPAKRQQYDQFGSDGFHQRYTQEDIFRGVDLGELFKEFGFSFSSDGGFGDLFGAGRRGRRQQAGGGRADGFSQTAPKGHDVQAELHISLENVYAGAKQQIEINGEQLEVTIPAGISLGKRLRLTGKGAPGPGGRGDLYLNIIVDPHPIYAVDGLDLLIDRDVRYSEAVLGGTLEVPTLSGEVKTVKIPAGTPSNSRIRLKGFGLKERSDKRGDLYVRILVKVPRQVSEQIADQLRQLSAQHSEI